MATPAEYNEKRYSLGLMTDAHLAQIFAETTGDDDIAKRFVQMHFAGVIDWQLVSDAVLVWQSSHGLIDDGMFGPASATVYDRLYNNVRIHPLLQKTLDVALEQEGKGEKYGDNAGEFVHSLRNFPYGDDYTRPIGNWCAFFGNWCMRQACTRLNVKPPFALEFRDTRFGKMMPFGSAKWHVEQLVAHGVRVPSLELVQPGDWIAKHRGKHNSRYGHFMIAAGFYDSSRKGVDIVEGNAGKHPSPVRVRLYKGDDLYLIGRLP